MPIFAIWKVLYYFWFKNETFEPKIGILGRLLSYSNLQRGFFKMIHFFSYMFPKWTFLCYMDNRIN